MVIQALIKAVAVGGIFFAWAASTIEASKISWHIISYSPKKETYEVFFRAACSNCQKIYDKVEHYPIHGPDLCEACR